MCISLSFKRGRIVFHHNPKQQRTNEWSRATVWKRRMSSLMLHVRASAKANCGRKNSLIASDLCHLRLESSETKKPHSHSHRRGYLQQPSLSNEGLHHRPLRAAPAASQSALLSYLDVCAPDRSQSRRLWQMHCGSHRFLDYSFPYLSPSWASCDSRAHENDSHIEGNGDRSFQLCDWCNLTVTKSVQNISHSAIHRILRVCLSRILVAKTVLIPVKFQLSVK